MSMETTIVYGCGFPVNISDETIIRFIKNHIDSVDKSDADDIMEYLNSGGNDIREEFFTHQFAYSDTGIEGVIAQIMANETDLSFEYCYSQDYGHGYIIFPEKMPWAYKTNESEITYVGLKNICERYIEELYDPKYETGKAEFGPWSVEYYG